MYNKLERLRYYLEETETEDISKDYIIDVIDDLERDLEIGDSTLRYYEDFDE